MERRGWDLRESEGRENRRGGVTRYKNASFLMSFFLLECFLPHVRPCSSNSLKRNRTKLGASTDARWAGVAHAKSLVILCFLSWTDPLVGLDSVLAGRLNTGPGRRGRGASSRAGMAMRCDD